MIYHEMFKTLPISMYDLRPGLFPGLLSGCGGGTAQREPKAIGEDVRAENLRY
jgi:hypothetical protein